MPKRTVTRTSKSWALTLAAAGLVMLSSCSSRHGLGDGTDCDYLILPATGEEVAFDTLACVNSDLSMDFEVNVEFLGPEEGGVGSPAPPTTLSQFRLSHYDITYRNLSRGGASVSGVDVPASARISVGALFSMEETEELVMTGFPVLRSSAKALPPLNDDAFYPNDSGTVFEATLTWWGHPVTDDNAWCFATMTWVFTVIPC